MASYLLGMVNRITAPLQQTLVKGQQVPEAKHMFMPNGTRVLGDQQREVNYSRILFQFRKLLTHLWKWLTFCKAMRTLA